MIPARQSQEGVLKMENIDDEVIVNVLNNNLDDLKRIFNFLKSTFRIDGIIMLQSKCSSIYIWLQIFFSFYRIHLSHESKN